MQQISLMSPNLPIDRSQFANTVLWLEDQKIRFYKIEDRQVLRSIGEKPDWEIEWNKAYGKLQKDLGMPKFESPAEELSWLLNHAVRLEYLDNGMANVLQHH